MDIYPLDDERSTAPVSAAAEAPQPSRKLWVIVAVVAVALVAVAAFALGEQRAETKHAQQDIVVSQEPAKSAAVKQSPQGDVYKRSGPFMAPPPVTATDPRKGTVSFHPEDYCSSDQWLKFCEGKNLVYRHMVNGDPQNTAITVVPDSKECS